MTWNFVFKAQLIKLWICFCQLLQTYIQSLNERDMNLTLESHPIKTEFQLRNNSLINDFQFIVFHFYVW